MTHRISYLAETDTERRCCELHPVNLTAKSEQKFTFKSGAEILMVFDDNGRLVFFTIVVCISMLKCTCIADLDNLLRKLFIPEISHIKLMIIILGVRLIQSDSV